MTESKDVIIPPTSRIFTLPQYHFGVVTIYGEDTRGITGGFNVSLCGYYCFAKYIMISIPIFCKAVFTFIVRACDLEGQFLG